MTARQEKKYDKTELSVWEKRETLKNIIKGSKGLVVFDYSKLKINYMKMSSEYQFIQILNYVIELESLVIEKFPNKWYYYVEIPCEK